MTRYTSLQALEGQIGKQVIVDGGRARMVATVEAHKAGAGQKGTAAPGKAAGRHAPEPPRMNKTERRYRDEVLVPALREGRIRKFRFEALNLRLGERTFHRPDFYVVTADGAIEIHEIKGGFIRDDARMKFKVAAEDWSEFRWQMWQYKDRRWSMILEL